MVRGINKTDIFINDQDRGRFLQRLGRNISEAKCSVYAWTLMDNHIPILFKSGEKGISTVMRKLCNYSATKTQRHKEKININLITEFSH